MRFKEEGDKVIALALTDHEEDTQPAVDPAELPPEEPETVEPEPEEDVTEEET